MGHIVHSILFLMKRGMDMDDYIQAGRATTRSVEFTGETHIVMTKNIKGTLTTKVTTRNAPHDTLVRKTQGLPFIRGIMLLLEMIWEAKITMGLLVVSLILLRFSPSGGSLKIPLLSWFPTSIVSIMIMLLLMASAVIKLTPLGKYHAAEHMAANAARFNEVVTVANAREQSRVHRSCGTNLLMVIYLLMLLLQSVIPNYILLFVVSFVVGYELHRLPSKFRLPIDWIGGFFQFFLFTSKPSDKHLKVAVASLVELKKRETIN